MSVSDTEAAFQMQGQRRDRLWLWPRQFGAPEIREAV